MKQHVDLQQLEEISCRLISMFDTLTAGGKLYLLQVYNKVSRTEPDEDLGDHQQQVDE